MAFSDHAGRLYTLADLEGKWTFLFFGYTYCPDICPTTLSMLSAMIGVLVGGLAGGQITGILLGIPGTPSSVATTFDGHPMATRGEPGRALAIGTWASFFGGLLSALILMFFTPPLADMALKFGPWEFFSLVTFGS